jgi:hypothetical protein
MFTNNALITILFRFINFAALVALLAYLFKKVAKPEINAQLQKKQYEDDTLYFQQTTLELQQRNLDLRIKEEAAQCEKFKITIDHWKKIVTTEHEHNLKQYERIMQKQIDNVHRKALAKHHNQTQAIITDAIAHDLETSLSAYFNNHQNGQLYLKKIIHFMEDKAL